MMLTCQRKKRYLPYRISGRWRTILAEKTDCFQVNSPGEHQKPEGSRQSKTGEVDRVKGLLYNPLAAPALSARKSDRNFFGRRLVVEFLWPLRGPWA